jgi:hypothetical protein
VTDGYASFLAAQSGNAAETCFSGAQYVFGILPYLAPILTLPLIGGFSDISVGLWPPVHGVVEFASNTVQRWCCASEHGPA